MGKLVVVLTLILAWTLYHLWERSKERSLYKLVAWSVGELSSLRVCIATAQTSLKLPSKYCVNWEEDSEFVKEILGKYQKDLTSAYFAERLIPLQSRYVITVEDYFLFSLFQFLHRHQNKPEFCGRRMRQESYCHISDFSVVYYKLLYISALFCTNSKNIGSIKGQRERNDLIYLSAQTVKSILDTGKVQT